jgi:hypothetical protein
VNEDKKGEQQGQEEKEKEMKAMYKDTKLNSHV